MARVGVFVTCVRFLIARVRLFVARVGSFMACLGFFVARVCLSVCALGLLDQSFDPVEP